MVKLSLKKKEGIANDWIRRHGAASFDFKNGNIILHDGGLFYIEKKKIKVHKIIGLKKLPNNWSQVIFSKKKTELVEDYNAILWCEELDETISYLKSMKRMLMKIGYDTGRSLRLKNRIVRKIGRKP